MAVPPRPPAARVLVGHVPAPSDQIRRRPLAQPAGPRGKVAVHSESSGEPPGFMVAVTAETVTVVLSGEFDVTTEDFLASRLGHVRRESPRRLIFDTARVTFIDCASARLIARAGDWLPPGVKPVIAYPPPIVRRVFEVSGLDARCELAFRGPP